jgi:nitroreductase
MDILDAIQARHSVRDFLPKPVPKDIVMKILSAATRSPSGGNGQPWEIFVASGGSMEAIRTAYQERARLAEAGPRGPGGPAGPGSPPLLPAFIQERMTTIRNERIRLMGLDPADPDSGKIFAEWRYRLFGVQTAAIICMDKALSSHLDIGLLVQTICLAAQHFGVDSIIASAFVTHPDILRKVLEIPEELNPVVGVGLGYPDPERIINTYRSPRRPIDEVVRYKS